LDSNKNVSKYNKVNKCLVIGKMEELIVDTDSLDYPQVISQINILPKPIFGYISYEFHHSKLLKNYKPKENILKNNLLHLFHPRYIFEINEDKVTINRNYPETFELIEMIQKFENKKYYVKSSLNLQTQISKKSYIENVNMIKDKITEGDFYEMNYCIESRSENSVLDTVKTFLKLNQNTTAPFASYLKINDLVVMGASPERFLMKRGEELIAQPIKGTAKRDFLDLVKDNQNKENLFNSIKERAENVMIVDLIRNDLTPYAQTGSIKVEELFGIYSYRYVHQMISTITAKLKDESNGLEALFNAFPPGSMTCAPKIEVMKNIEQFEENQRGIYSGAVGYIDENGDYDFNVVIRSLIYNTSTKTVSLMAGSAITALSVAEEEYEECLLKMESVMRGIG
jgi:para-aminobenzoate synthetase component I